MHQSAPPIDPLHPAYKTLGPITSARDYTGPFKEKESISIGKKFNGEM